MADQDKREREQVETEQPEQVVEGEIVNESDDLGISDDDMQTAQNDTVEVVSEAGDLAAELDAAQAKANEHWDRMIRLQAEMDNLRKRSTRDVENARKYSLEKFAEALLPVKDSMEMGLSHGEAEPAKVLEGVELTLKQLSDVLEKFGIETVDPVGEAFDPERHEAMAMQDSDEESNTVLTVVQKGYVLNGRLVRPARVIVSR